MRRTLTTTCGLLLLLLLLLWRTGQTLHEQYEQRWAPLLDPRQPQVRVPTPQASNMTTFEHVYSTMFGAVGLTGLL